jgi:hypothetical protein
VIERMGVDHRPVEKRADGTISIFMPEGAIATVFAKETIAAHVTARPARQTGTTTASRRGGGKVRCLTAPLPVQVQPVLEACAEQCDQKERDHGGKGNEATTVDGDCCLQSTFPR